MPVIGQRAMRLRGKEEQTPSQLLRALQVLVVLRFMWQTPQAVSLPDATPTADNDAASCGHRGLAACSTAENATQPLLAGHRRADPGCGHGSHAETAARSAGVVQWRQITSP